MSIAEKKVGIFTHYLTSGKFQPRIEKAQQFTSKEMAVASISATVQTQIFGEKIECCITTIA